MKKSAGLITGKIIMQVEVTNIKQNGWRAFKLTTGDLHDLLIVKRGDQHLISIDIPARNTIRFFNTNGQFKLLHGADHALEYKITKRKRDGRLCFKTPSDAHDPYLTLIDAKRTVVGFIRIVINTVIEFYGFDDNITIEPY